LAPSKFFDIFVLMNTEILSEDDLDLIGDKISGHANLYHNIPIKAEYWESIVSSTLGVDWTPNNHNTNRDLVTPIQNMSKPSLKSGIIKKGFLIISSHRTTEHKTLDDKIQFLKSRDLDSYLCLSRTFKGKITHKYKLIYFNKNIIDWDSFLWVDTYNKKGEHSGYLGTNPTKTIIIKIHLSMSHQVWVEIDMNLVTILREYEY